MTEIRNFLSKEFKPFGYKLAKFGIPKFLLKFGKWLDKNSSL